MFPKNSNRKVKIDKTALTVKFAETVTFPSTMSERDKLGIAMLLARSIFEPIKNQPARFEHITMTISRVNVQGKSYAIQCEQVRNGKSTTVSHRFKQSQIAAQFDSQYVPQAGQPRSTPASRSGLGARLSRWLRQLFTRPIETPAMRQFKKIVLQEAGNLKNDEEKENFMQAMGAILNTAAYDPALANSLPGLFAQGLRSPLQERYSATLDRIETAISAANLHLIASALPFTLSTSAMRTLKTAVKVEESRLGEGNVKTQQFVTTRKALFHKAKVDPGLAQKNAQELYANQVGEIGKQTSLKAVAQQRQHKLIDTLVGDKATTADKDITQALQKPAPTAEYHFKLR